MGPEARLSDGRAELRRSSGRELAKKIGLGRKPKVVEVVEAPKTRAAASPPPDQLGPNQRSFIAMPVRSAISAAVVMTCTAVCTAVAPDELDALEQRAHVVDGQHSILAAEADVGERAAGALLGGALEHLLEIGVGRVVVCVPAWRVIDDPLADLALVNWFGLTTATVRRRCGKTL